MKGYLDEVGGIVSLGGYRPPAVRPPPTRVFATDIARASDASQVSGEARIYEWPRRHFTIETETQGGSVLHTEAYAPHNWDVVVEHTGSTDEAVRVYKIPLQDAQSAQRYQRQVLGTELDEYDREFSSCLTHCGELLEAGGVRLPKSGWQMTSSYDVLDFLKNL